MSNNDLELARASFERAVTFLKSGDAAMAELVCRQALKEVHSDPNLLCLLGASLIRQRKAGEAEKPLSRAVKLFPSDPRAHEGLAEVFMIQGKLTAALESLQQAKKLQPDSPSIRLKLGKVLAGIGRDDEAGQAFEESFALTPHRETLVKGLQLQRMGDLKQAEKQYRSVLSQDPDDVDALRLLAGLAMRAKQWGDAEVMLNKALGLAPDFYQGWMDLGLANQEQDQTEAALRAYNKAMVLEPEFAAPYTAAGTANAMAGRHDEAIALFKQALERQEDHAGALAGLGHVLKTIGQYEESIAAYRRCAELNPDHGEAYWSLANLKTFEFSNNEVTKMQEMIENPALLNEPKVNFLFALGKAREDRKQFDAAFEHYQRGNELRRSAESYDPVSTMDTHDRLIEVFSADFFAQRSDWGHGSNAPIFIVGLPRSGSTLLEQILASHSQVEGTHELPELSRAAKSTRRYGVGERSYPKAVLDMNLEESIKVGERYLLNSKRHRHEDSLHFTDKLPNNFAHIGLLQLILPNAKIIDARRHPLDSCMGTYKQLFARGQPFSYDLYELGEFYLEYRRLMSHWNEVLPGKVLQVQYEQVVDDLENQVRRILDFCELPFEQSCVDFHQSDRAVKTASSEQVRQPIYRSAVQSWRRFEQHLGPLVEILEPILQELPENERPESMNLQA